MQLLTDCLAERVGIFEMRILRYCPGVSLEEHKTNESISIRQEAKVMDVLKLMRRRRLQWFEHTYAEEKKRMISEECIC